MNISENEMLSVVFSLQQCKKKKNCQCRVSTFAVLLLGWRNDVSSEMSCVSVASDL